MARVAGAAGEHLGALGDGVLDEIADARRRFRGDARAEHHMAARIAGRQRARLGGELGQEGIGDAVVDDDLLGRHADLAGIGEGAEGGGIDRLVDVGVVENDQRRLAAEFEQHRLQIAPGGLGDDAADAGGAGEIDAADLGMGDQRLDHLGGILPARSRPG